MKDFKDIKKALQTYLIKIIGFPIVFILLFSIGIYFFYLDSDAFSSPASIKYGLLFPFQTLFLVPFFIRTTKKSVLVILDLLTGCKTKDMVVQILRPAMDLTFFVSEKNKSRHRRERYSAWTFKTENGKKMHMVKDEFLCDDRIVRGNIHTVCVLYYSNFLLKSCVGKK